MIARALGAVVHRLARLRGARALHPKGTVYDATLVVHDGPLRLGEHPALVRLSRGLGLPDALPDVLGLAIRVLDTDQDLLLSGVGRDARGHAYTSLFGFEAGGEPFRYNASPAPGGFDLTIDGRRVATLRLGPEIEGDEPRFDIWRHTGGGIRPVGALNRLRMRAYPESQRGWEPTPPTASR